MLKGIVEADETYVLESRKGARGLGRKARRRGGKAKKRGLSREQVEPVLIMSARSAQGHAAALTAALDPVREGSDVYEPRRLVNGLAHVQTVRLTSCVLASASHLRFHLFAPGANDRAGRAEGDAIH